MLNIELREVNRRWSDAKDARQGSRPRQQCDLQEQLLQARRASDQLSEELESPENKQRWRRLREN